MAQPIPVLHVISTLKVGGAERQLVTLLRALDQERFEHHVIALFQAGPLEDEVRELPVRYTCLHTRHRRLPWHLYQLLQYMRRNRIQVLHSHLSLSAVYARICATAAGVPVRIYTEHSDVTRRSRFDRMLERLMIPITTQKISVSEAQRHETVTREGWPAAKVVTVANSIPLEDFTPDQERRRAAREALGYQDDQVVIGNIAIHSAQKRLDRLIEAFAALRQRHANVRLVLVGDGPLHEDLKRQAQATGLQDDIQLLGRRGDVADLLQAMDVFAITSRWEGLPINLLEAMGSGLAIISTDVGGIGETVEDDVSGLLIPEHDSEQYEKKLEELVLDAQRRQKLGSGALRRVQERHSSQLNARQIEAIYLSLVR